MTGSGSHPAPLPELPPTEHNGGSRAPYPRPAVTVRDVGWVPPSADRSRQGEHAGAKVSTEETTTGQVCQRNRARHQ